MSLKGLFLQLTLLSIGFLIVEAAGSRKSLQEIMESFDNRTCHKTDVLASQIDVCAKPLMDLIEGTLAEWPHTEDEMDDLCKKFAVAESCIRDRGRKCAKGLNRVFNGKPVAGKLPGKCCCRLGL